MGRLLARRRVRRMLVVAALVLGAVVWLLVRGDRTETYVPGERTDGLVDSLGRALPDDRPAVSFRDVAAEAGLRFAHFDGVRANRLPEDMGSGLALGDVDGDGWTDVFLVNAHPLPAGVVVTPELAASVTDSDPARREAQRSRLFRNLGGGRFADVTDASGIDLATIGMAAAFLDVEGDGDLDLLVSSYGALDLLLNDGTGRFADGTAAAGLADFHGFHTGLAVGDPDGDDDVDVYVCGYVRYDETLAPEGASASQYGADIPVRINPSAFEPEPNLFLRNRGDGTFVDAAAELGVDNRAGRSLGAVFADLSGDGRPDLYVANDVSDNALFVNRGDGSFEDRTAQALVGDYRGAMGMAVSDFDEDGDLDLFITHWVAQENALYVNITADLQGAGDGQLVFFDEADRRGLGQIALRMVGWATRFLDWDADGHLDLFVVNGHTIPLREAPTTLAAMPMQVFWNGGGERGFFELGPAAGSFFAEPFVGRGGATCDVDLDGREDVFVVRHGGPAALLENATEAAGRVLRVRLRQPSGNTYALGARVEVEAGGRTRVDVLGTQGSYLSQHVEGETVFGLGDLAQVDRVGVRWPDGTRETAGPFDADGILVWTRGDDPRWTPLPGRAASAPAFDLSAPRVTNVAHGADEQRRFYALRDEANQLRVAGEFAAAAARYREALALRPDHEDCLYSLGNCLLETGDERAAADTYAKLAALAPHAGRAWMQLGKLRLPGGDPSLDDLGLAREAFERAHAINGEESGPVVQLGVTALLSGDLDRADAWFADAAVLNARSVEARYWRGCIAFLRGDEQAALALLAEAHAVATGAQGKGESKSSEGDTRTGAALVAAREAASTGHVLDRWRDLAGRPVDVHAEYAALPFATPRDEVKSGDGR